LPFKGKSRFEKGAVEDASIYIPAVAGGKVRRGSGGGYGYFSESLDPSGRVIARVGHGNIDRPEAGDVNVIGNAPVAPQLPAATLDSDARARDILKAFLYGTQAQGETQQKTLPQAFKEQLLGTVMSEALNPTAFLSSYAMNDPYMSGFNTGSKDFFAGLLG
jgi:hypothetical protein